MGRYVMAQLRKAVCASLLPALMLAGCDYTAPQAPQAGDTAPPESTRPPVATVEPTDAADTPNPPTSDIHALPGTFAPSTDLAALQARFGKGNVRLDKVPGAEGESFDGVILFPDDPPRRAYLYFQDAQTNRGLSMVRVFDAGSRWHFENDIRIGTPLSTVLARNGKPIGFYGLAWDYGGTITEWNGGALAPQPEGPVQQRIQLGLREGVTRDYPMGDAEFSSDDPRFPHIGQDLVVAEIGVSFRGEDDL